MLKCLSPSFDANDLMEMSIEITPKKLWSFCISDHVNNFESLFAKLISRCSHFKLKLMWFLYVKSFIAVMTT